MILTVLSSLDALCRQQAFEALAAAHPSAVFDVHDLLENGTVICRTFRHDSPGQRQETVLEHGCLSCTVLGVATRIQQGRHDYAAAIGRTTPGTVRTAPRAHRRRNGGRARTPG